MGTLHTDVGVIYILIAARRARFMGGFFPAGIQASDILIEAAEDDFNYLSLAIIFTMR